MKNNMVKIGDYNKIMSDRNIFNQIVYTPMSEALRLLDERRKDKKLVAKVEKLLNGNVPEFFKNKKCGILSRHVATPNHESRMFIAIAKEHSLHPVFFEFHDDKFTNNNNYKHSLGQLRIQQRGTSKNGDPLFEKLTIVDFNIYNGKRLKNTKTIWLEPLTDFHKKLFSVYNYNSDDFLLYDASIWFKKSGGKAVDYYTNFFLLFTCFGILFENFLTSNDENGKFTQSIVLPSIEKVLNLTGVKPLITPIGPLEIETDELWFQHLPKVKTLVPSHKYAK